MKIVKNELMFLLGTRVIRKVFWWHTNIRDRLVVHGNWS